MTQERKLSSLSPISLLFSPKPGARNLSDPNSWNSYQLGPAMPDHDLANWHERALQAGIKPESYLYNLAHEQANKFAAALEASGRTRQATDLRREITKIFV
jgi:hypothetical protein